MLTDIDDQAIELLEIITGLAQAIRCCRQDEAFCEGVTFHQFAILDAVAKNDELNMADLHGILSVQKSTTTRLVNPLVIKGLLKKSKADHDTRVTRLILTDEGAEMHRRVMTCLANYAGTVVFRIPENMRKEVFESVRIFIAALKEPGGKSCCGT